MGFRYMSHSHGQPFRQDTLTGLHLPMGSGTRLRSASAKSAAIVKNSFEWRSAEICPPALSALDGFDMAEPYPLFTLPRNAPISIAVNCLAKGDLADTLEFAPCESARCCVNNANELMSAKRLVEHHSRM
jgi:hypothetical protein